MDELKPCPFCGSTELEVGYNYIECECGAMGPDPKASRVPDVEWQARPIENTLMAEVAALKAQLERWEAPLTIEQMNRFVYKWVMNGENLPGIDAAIRQVRSDG